VVALIIYSRVLGVDHLKGGSGDLSVRLLAAWDLETSLMGLIYIGDARKPR